MLLSGAMIYKWFELSDNAIHGLHIDYVQAPQTRLEDLFMALMTDYSTEARPIDLLVVLCAADIVGLKRKAILDIMKRMQNG